jgi:hypothetical protein
MPTQQIRIINGVVRTSEPVWQNIERLSEASVAWFTYDVHTGLYSWVINDEGNSAASITEADIIGPIQISGSSLTNQYNAVEIEYPNTEIRDQPHYVRIELPQYLRNAYEPDNTLQMTSEFINNQPQAEHLAMITLKQSRLDRSVTINMDYTRINLRAGDIISITSDTYGWTAKEFRIMRVREVEGNDGSLILEFQLTEYDDTIYDGDFSEFLVGGAPGIRSLGSIGQPGQPTVTLTTLDSLPAQSVDSTVPSGVVDRMQFWAGNVAVTGNVNTTEFDFIGDIASPNANGFTVGDTATFVTTSLRDGTWAWKTRGINTYGTGPFSLLSGNTQYSRLQAPDAIKAGTPIYSVNGTLLTGAAPMLSVFNGIANVANLAMLPNTSATSSFYTTGNFVAPVSGIYSVDVIMDTFSATGTIGNNQVFGGRGVTIDGSGTISGERLDWAQGYVDLRYASNSAVVVSEGSGGPGYNGGEDFIMVKKANLVANVSYNLDFRYSFYSNSAPNAVFSTAVSWNIYTLGNTSS